MFTQVPCNQLHLCSFARIFFFTFIALFSNGYKYHTQWSYPRCIYCGLVFLLKKRTLLQLTIIGEGIESAMCSTSAIIDISDELNLRIWTWFGLIDNSGLYHSFIPWFCIGSVWGQKWVSLLGVSVFSKVFQLTHCGKLHALHITSKSGMLERVQIFFIYSCHPLLRRSFGLSCVILYSPGGTCIWKGWGCLSPRLGV